eukprot:354776-Chlamydomonas_euryale.AAC.3
MRSGRAFDDTPPPTTAAIRATGVRNILRRDVGDDPESIQLKSDLGPGSSSAHANAAFKGPVPAYAGTLLTRKESVHRCSGCRMQNPHVFLR